MGAVTRLGVPALLAAGPRPTVEIAAAIGADAGSLVRLLRLLADLGFLAGTDGGWALTARGRTQLPATSWLISRDGILVPNIGTRAAGS